MADGDVVFEARRRSAVEVKTVNLALQGGGAHGAFTWGVLDRLLEDRRIGFEGVSATGAGSVNAAVLAHGLALGGRDGARAALANFWRRISHSGLATTPQAFFERGAPSPLELSPAYVMFDLMTRMFSPYELNPLNADPLRAMLEAEVDFERLRREASAKVFLGATNVRTGRLRVFETHEITVDHVMASACQPLVSQAVEIDGEAYWDGGYAGSPALFPFFAQCMSRDVILIRVSPEERRELPRSAREILSRMSEISFNAALGEELRALAAVSRRIDEGRARPDALRRILLHAIEADEIMAGLSAASRVNTDWEFLTGLRDLGRAQAGAWLAGGFDSLGQRATLHYDTACLETSA
ncbi:MAG: patatin-like phospholipase family protein [Phenylobacterium sp.]|nr:patatin-like phospholipase family protein [Phenylobacterium sp.]